MRDYDIEIVRKADTELLNRYQEVERLLGINKEKENNTMVVDVDKIYAEIEALKTLNAEEFCADEVAKLYADFEASRDTKIADLEKVLDIIAKFEVIEDTSADDYVAEV